VGIEMGKVLALPGREIQGDEMMTKEGFKFLHNFPEFLKQVLWRYIPDTPHVQYWYAESEHYILKFQNGTYGFVTARSPTEAYENFLKENSKEAK
jgi:hypothetical protein